jgi:ABC-type transport system substrate-binding protein
MMDADGGLRGLYTTTVTGTNERNYSLYSNADVDRLLTEGMQETDPAKRLEIYKQAQQIMVFDDPAGVWIYDMTRANATTADLAKAVYNGTGLPIFYRYEFKTK